MGDHRLCDEIQWRQGSKVRLLVGVASRGGEDSDGTVVDAV